MADNAQVLLSFGVNEGSLKSAVKAITAGLRTGMEKALSEKTLKLPKIDARTIEFKYGIDLSNIKTQGFIKVPIEKIRFTGGAINLSDIPVKGKLDIPIPSVTSSSGSTGTSPVAPSVAPSSGPIGGNSGDKTGATEASIGSLKSFAFNVGLVGYALENLGRRFTTTAQNMFAFVEGAAKATEGIQRLKNFTTQLVDAGAINPAQRTSILTEIRKIAEMPGGSFDTIIHAFNALNTLGVSYSDNLRLIAGLQNSVARSGDTTTGIPTIVKLFERAKATEKVQGRSLVTVIDASGKDIQDAFQRAFGGADEATLEQFTWGELIQRLIPELEKVPKALATSQDRVERINIAWTYMKDAILGIADVALDNLLGKLQSLEGILVGLRARFDALSPEKQNFISSLLTAIPVVLGVLGTLLSVLGVLALSIGVVSKISGVWVQTMAFLAKSSTAVVVTTEVAASKFSLLGLIGSKISGIFAPVSEVFSGLALSMAGIGDAGLIVTESLTGIAGGILKVVGLTPGIGTVINLILAYATNAGHARDNINYAFGGLFTSINKLFTEIGTFLNGPTASKVIAFIIEVSNFIGGVLGDALTALIIQLKDVVDLLGQFFGLLNNSKDFSWANFGATLANALFGGFDTLAKLLAATFFDALAKLADQGLFGILTHSKVFQDLADFNRENIGHIGFDTDKHVGNADKQNANVGVATLQVFKATTAETVKLNTNLQKTQTIIDSMGMSMEKARASFAKANADIELADIKFRNAQSQREASERLAELIKSQGTGAIGAIDAQQAKANVQGQAEIAAANKLELPAIAEQLRLAGQEMDRAIDKAGNVDLSGAQKQFVTFRVSLGQLIDLAKSGKADISSFGAAFERMGTAFGEFNKVLPKVQTKKGLEELGEVSKAYGAALPIITNYNQVLSNQVSETHKLKQANEQTAEAQRKSARAVQDAADALTTARPEQLKLAELEAQHRKDVDLVNSGVTLTGKLLEELNAREVAYQTARNASQDAIKNTLNVNNELVKTETEATEKQTTAIQTQAELTEKAYQNRIKLNASLMQSFTSGFTELDAFKQKLDAINESRAKFGALPLQAPPSKTIGAQLDLQSSPLLNINDQILGFNDADGKLRVLINTLKEGKSLSKEFSDSLLKVGQGSATAFDQLIDDISKTQQGITSIRLKILGAKEGSKGEKDLEDELDRELKTQTRLGEEAQVYVNRLMVVNKISEANAKILLQQFNTIKRINEAEQFDLQLKQQELELRISIAEKEEENRLKSVGLGPTKGTFLTYDAADKAAEESKKRQIELIHTKYKLDLLNIEVKKDELKAELELNIITKERYDAVVALYNNQQDLLTKKRNLDVAGLDSDKFTNSQKRINYVRQQLDELHQSGQNAADGILGLFDAIASGQYVLDSFADAILNGGSLTQAFGDLAQTAFAAFGKALGQALVDTIVNGGNFLKSLGKFFGQMLIQIGEMLIQVGIAALALSVLAWAFPILKPLIDPSSAGTGAAVAAIAIGTGLVVAGALLGGGGSSSTSQTASSNSTNTANSQAGATGQAFDPNKDPKTLYQKALAAQITIDIRTDDTQIVKTVIKHVNGNGRLATLIGNRKLQFGY